MINRKGIESFVRNSHRSRIELLNPLNRKDQIRYDLAIEVLEQFKGKKINILTLPSAWWNFEKSLIYLNQKFSFGVDFQFFACEKDKFLYYDVVSNMPRTFGSNLNICDACSSTDIAEVSNKDIFECIHSDYKGVRFDFIWLDLMCTVGTIRGHMVRPLPDIAPIGSELIVTYLRARDRFKDRNKVIADCFLSSGYDIDNVVAYTDTTPMSQVKFIKKRNSSLNGRRTGRS